MFQNSPFDNKPEPTRIETRLNGLLTYNMSMHLMVNRRSLLPCGKLANLGYDPSTCRWDNVYPGEDALEWTFRHLSNSCQTVKSKQYNKADVSF